MDKKWPAWIVLGLIALIAGCALGLTNEVTAASTSCRESLATQAPFADLPHTPPRGPSFAPTGQFTLCRQIRIKP